MSQPGAMLHVKVVPGASRTRFAGRYGDGIRMQVAAAPERGKANAAVIALLAELMEVPAARIQLVAGQTHPRKVFTIHGLSPAGLEEKLAKLGRP